MTHVELKVCYLEIQTLDIHICEKLIKFLPRKLVRVEMLLIFCLINHIKEIMNLLIAYTCNMICTN